MFFIKKTRENYVIKTKKIYTDKQQDSSFLFVSQ